MDVGVDLRVVYCVAGRSTCCWCCQCCVHDAVDDVGVVLLVVCRGDQYSVDVYVTPYATDDGTCCR